MRPNAMSMSPLCGRLANFYRVSRPVRQKLATATQNGKNPCIFCGQSGCRCRPSAAVWPISIPRSALCVKNWPPAAIPCIFCSKMASDCSWPLPSWTANFPNLAACQNLFVFKLNSLSKMPFWSLPPPRGLLEVPGPLSLGSSSGFSWLLLAVPGRS